MSKTHEFGNELARAYECEQMAVGRLLLRRYLSEKAYASWPCPFPSPYRPTSEWLYAMSSIRSHGESCELDLVSLSAKVPKKCFALAGVAVR